MRCGIPSGAAGKGGWVACTLVRARRLGMMLLALSLAGCSISTPIASLIGGDEDEVATGSIPQAAPKSGAGTRLSDRLNGEDWRRARAALAVALDPEGNGTPVKWDNPETKASGSFAAGGAFFTRNHFVCRPFLETLRLGGVETSTKGSACRQGPSDWVIDDHDATERSAAAPPASAASSRSSRKSRKAAPAPNPL